MMRQLINTKMLVMLAFSIQVGCVLGQQSTRISQYFFSPILINPAAAGNNGMMLSTGLKSMWNGIPGAPETQFIAGEGHLLHKKIGWGVEIQNDQAALLRQKKIIISGAYRHRVAANSWLSFGAGVGPKQHTYDGHLASFKQVEDPTIPNQRINQVKPVVNLGLFFSTDRLQLGLSSENAYQYEIDFNGVSQPGAARAKARISLSARYQFTVTKNLLLYTGLLYKYESKNPDQLDITPMLEYNRRFSFGIGYRYQESVSGIVQFEIIQGFRVGYAYDYQTNGLSSVSNNSHELMIRYAINTGQNGYKNPRDFFRKTKN